jgi:hypothetical protein
MAERATIGEGGTVPDAPEPSGWPRAFAMVALLLVGGTLLYLLRPKQKPAPPPPPVQVVAPAPAPAPAPTKPAPSRISIVTDPAEADVMNGPERLGRTPVTLELLPDSEPLEVTISKKGFAEQKLRLVPDRSREYVLRLTAARKPSHAKEPPPPVAAPQPPPPQKPPEQKKSRELKDIFAD